ncbi:MAG: sulfotransferase [Bacteroidia bacterium]|nr:sulfotransferase [Bacteroidia bacterium]
MEEIMFGRKTKDLIVKEHVFVTGLARSGTTAVMNKIFDTGEYASLQYANMPFILCPNLWKRKLKIESHERAHKDGIIIDGNSPEEFDEYFWKAFLKDSYIKDDGLLPHIAEDKVIEKYESYVKLICLAKGKDKYISKNNNNILRLSSLERIKEHKIIILFRNPLSHSSSLMKLDKSFSKNQEEDPFSLDYFNYLGHHEFGLNHKPFLLTSVFNEHRTKYSREDLNYWLSIWLNYYSYVLENYKDKFILIGFEDLIESPDSVYEFISGHINVNSNLQPGKKHKPSSYSSIDYDEDLMQNCMLVYKQLSELTKYKV